MKKVTSKNYDFHFLENSIAEKDIQEIIKIQENCYMEICTYLNIEPDIRIQYYLLDTPELVGEVYGDNEPCNGFASPPDTIYAVYNDEIKCIGPHEDAHILSYTINRPKSVFIREGLAMFFDKLWWGKTNEEWVKSFIGDNKYIDIGQLLLDNIFYKYSDALTYPIAGAFTRYLLENYGIKKYLSLYEYTGENFINRVKEIYGKDIDELDKEFISSIF